MDPTRDTGLERLQDFLPRSGALYARNRNLDESPAPRTAVSELSAHVRHRLLLESELAFGALQQHSPTACEKFVQEVCWRTYWKGWLQHRPSVWARYTQERDASLTALRESPGLRTAYEAARDGRTGMACFDTWTRELQQTGYLHNHARMWFASIWIFTLRLPWALGADLFMRSLRDADAASNTLSWRWVAGLHTPGKHYLARAENIARYTEGRFDPRGQLDEQASALPPDKPAPLEPLALLPAPQRGLRSALLIHDEDCSPETLLRGDDPAPLGIAVWHAGIAARSPATLADAALAFAGGALHDAVARATQRWPGASLQAEDTTLLDWLRAQNLQQVLLAEPCAGPTADTLNPVIETLRGAGIRVCLIRRDWDARFWPHATRGFFQLRSRIPQLLAELMRPSLF